MADHSSTANGDGGDLSCDIMHQINHSLHVAGCSLWSSMLDIASHHTTIGLYSFW